MLSNSQKSWLNNAEKICAAHDSGGKRHMVAIAVVGNRIQSIGKNEYIKYRGGACYDSTYEGRGVHAELACLFNGNCRSSTIYIVGRSKHSLVTTKPCPLCATLLKNSSVKRLIYYVEGLPVVVSPKDL